MTNRVLVFTTSGSLRLKYKQLIWNGDNGQISSIPIEDVSLVLIESTQVNISTALLIELSCSNVAVVFCDSTHMPRSYLLPCCGHTMSQRILRSQISVSKLKADILWGQTIRQKIINQASVASFYNSEVSKELLEMAREVKRGDPNNLEAQAAKIYFSIFTRDDAMPFRRLPEGEMPNPALNYGYAILRAMVARSLVSSGLNCMIGIHHNNQYNPYCLADDIMEPYRPFVDLIVLSDIVDFEMDIELTPKMKGIIMKVLSIDVEIGKMVRPLANALSLTTSSFAKVVSGEQTKIVYPKLPMMV